MIKIIAAKDKAYIQFKEIYEKRLSKFILLYNIQSNKNKTPRNLDI